MGASAFSIPLSRSAGEGGFGRSPKTGEGFSARTLTLPSLRDGPLPLPHCGRGGFAEMLRGALPDQLGEALLWGHTFGDRLLRVFVAQLLETEMAARGDFKAARQRVLAAAEQPRHLRRRLQV